MAEANEPSKDEERKERIEKLKRSLAAKAARGELKIDGEKINRNQILGMFNEWADMPEEHKAALSALSVTEDFQEKSSGLTMLNMLEERIFEHIMAYKEWLINVQKPGWESYKKNVEDELPPAIKEQRQESWNAHIDEYATLVFAEADTALQQKQRRVERERETLCDQPKLLEAYEEEIIRIQKSLKQNKKELRNALGRASLNSVAGCTQWAETAKNPTEPQTTATRPPTIH